jgi:hypothetical protein
MRLVVQREYRQYTLLNFERRNEGHEKNSHWLIIAPDGINVLGPPKKTEAEARTAIDALIDARPQEPTTP